MRQGNTLQTWTLTLLVGLVVGLTLVVMPPPAWAADEKPGSWTFGAGGGFLSGTPNGTAFAMNFYGDAFLTRNLSLGPLLQLGFTGHESQIGVSGQAKYWIDVPGTANRLKVTPQAGIGLVHAAFRDDDTSWLIVLGAGADYRLTNTLSVTGTLLINFTDLDTGGGTGADVMPGFTIGVRF
jgi:hypothetical protein